MIRYALRCAKGHEFEAWFANSSAFDTQRTKGAVRCPTCTTSRVEKALMSPRISKGSARKSAEDTTSSTTSKAEITNVAAPAMPPEARAVLRKLREEIVSKADYVGPRFAEEARKIHYKETEERGVWGEASAEDARELLEEGISILPLPKLPEDQN